MDFDDIKITDYYWPTVLTLWFVWWLWFSNFDRYIAIRWFYITNYFNDWREYCRSWRAPRLPRLFPTALPTYTPTYYFAYGQYGRVLLPHHRMPGSFPVDEESAVPTLDDIEADEGITRPDERSAGETTHKENDREQPPRSEMPGAFPEDGESTVLTPNGAVADGGMVSGNNSAPPSSVEGDDTAQP